MRRRRLGEPELVVAFLEIQSLELCLKIGITLTFETNIAYFLSVLPTKIGILPAEDSRVRQNLAVSNP